MLVHTKEWPTSYLHHMRLAVEVAKRSKCVSRQVGAVLLRDDRIIATGYNGPPTGSMLCHDGICIWPLSARAFRSDLSGCPAAHAEANCINNAARMGHCTHGATLVCACGIPCSRCLIALRNAGITNIVCLPETYGMGLFYDDLSRRLVDEDLFMIMVMPPLP